MILLLNTASPLCKLVIVDNQEEFSYEWQADRQLANGLLGFMVESLAKHHQTLGGISGIGVFRGPGSFTGLRIGLTVANTIADASNIPIIGETGEAWLRRAVERLQAGEDEGIVLPLYDRPANITRPRK